MQDFPAKLFSMTAELLCNALFHIKYDYILLSSTKYSSLFSLKQLNPFLVEKKKDIIKKIYAIFIQFHLFNFHYHSSNVFVFLFYQK